MNRIRPNEIITNGIIPSNIILNEIRIKESRKNIYYIAAAATIAGIISLNTLSPDKQDLLGAPNAFKVVQSLNINPEEKNPFSIN